MIRHVLLVRFKEDAQPQAIAELQAAFAAIPSKVQGVEAVEWGENDSPENKNRGFTHCILMTFADQKGRDNYLPHPEHEALKVIFRRVLDEIIVLDYSL
ncbi:Dabb family protein [Psychromonas aquimarina]|uniref:Dabb family protein n=1 Tax=Psychromonas aquimarina TaxID=444919 RepID=UPI000405CB75|nr:Dabb family protein [Psychromonas aquimarina]